jgi:PAS domain-containing protein
MTYSTLPASRIPLRRNRSPGVAEFEGLFNLIPGACLLFDRQQNAVVMVNSQLLQLTAFTAKELTGARIDSLMPELATAKVAPGEEMVVYLNRRMREPVRVNVKTTALDKDAQWLVLSLQPAPEGMQYTSPEFMALFRILLELTKIAEMTEINQSLNRALGSYPPNSWHTLPVYLPG